MSNVPDTWKGLWPREFETLFDGFGFPLLRRAEADLTRNGFNPRCEVSEDKQAYHVKFDLPGVPKDQIKIDLHENRLTVSGERRSEKKDDSKHQHFSEVFYGSFSRSMSFPSGVDTERTSATFENGTLNIVVPKVNAARSRQIDIK